MTQENRKMPVPARIVHLGKALAALGLLAACLAGVAGPSPPACRALVTLNDTAWLVSDHGVPLQRFAMDADTPCTLSLDPQGRRIAYLAAGRLKVVTTDTHYTITPQAAGPLRKVLLEASAVSFLPDGLLRLKHAVSPGSARFDFYRLDESTKTLQPVGKAAYGAICILSQRFWQAACLHTTDVLLDGRVIHSATGFDLSRPWQTLHMAPGESIATKAQGQDEPVFRVQVTSLEDGVTLRVTNPLGQWQESRLQGDVMTMTFSGQRYGFSPRLAPETPGEVHVDVFRDEATGDPFDHAITWLGDRLAVIQRHGANRSLVLLQPNPQDPTLPWVARSVALPWSERVNAMRLIAPGRLLLHTGARFALVRLDEAEGQGLALRILQELPATLAVQGHGTVPVLDWQCPAAIQ
jgi:hypothetical protein